jgi:hypothetical protein
MYEYVPENERKVMTEGQLEKKYRGKWVFLTNVTDYPFSGIPAVVADAPMEGCEKGVYKPFFDAADSAGVATGEISLLNCPMCVSGFNIV